MAQQSFDSWREEVIRVAESKYQIPEFALQDMASHVLEEQYFTQSLTPDEAVDSLVRDYPPIS